MSTSPETGGARSAGKAPEVSNFSQRAFLLSQFLKGKRPLGDINFAATTKRSELKAVAGISGESSRQAAATVKLPPIMEISDEDETRNTVTSEGVKSLDFLFKRPGSSSSLAKEKADTDARKCGGNIKEGGSAQLTIIYRGKVMVFDDFPGDKMKEIVGVAAMGSSSTTFNNNSSRSGKNPAHPVQQQFPGKPNLPTASDLPIARRGSLHRFLEKRKDRVAKTPYHVINLPSEATETYKSDDENNSTNPYMEAESSDDSRHLDLKL